MTDIDVHVTARGEVDEQTRRYAEAKLARLARLAPRPVLYARVAIDVDGNPSVARPVHAKASLDVSGRLVRAQVAAGSTREAIDLLEGRLRRGLEILAGAHEPRRGAASRPATSERTPDEREVVRIKSYDIAPASLEDAALEMELLDHDFHLFRDAESGRFAVVYRHDDGIGVLEAPEVGGLGPACARLHDGAQPFVFFEDEETGLASIVYRRLDGHYGVVSPAV